MSKRIRFSGRKKHHLYILWLYRRITAVLNVDVLLSFLRYEGMQKVQLSHRQLVLRSNCFQPQHSDGI